MSADPVVLSPEEEALTAEVAALEAQAEEREPKPEELRAAALRERKAAALARIAAADIRLRAAAVDAAEDEARAALGPTIPIAKCMDEEASNPQGFVLRYAGSAPFVAWEQGTGRALTLTKDPRRGNKVPDKADVDRAFAMANIYSWVRRRPDGSYFVTVIPEGPSNERAELDAEIKRLAGLASSLAMAARALSGAATEARKSGG
jgi:hypothetical protein